MIDYKTLRTPGIPFNTDRFITANTDFPIYYTWAWNAPVSKDGIRERIDTMADGGITAFYILPLPKEFRPTTMITEMEPDYLSPEFFAMVSYAVDYAASKGMSCWLYDEGGWPSGAACGKVTEQNPAVYRKVIRTKTTTLPAGMPYHAPAQLIAAFAGKVRIEDSAVFAVDTLLKECFLAIESTKFPDFYDSETLDTFIALTHDRYAEAFGELISRIPCMFTDEPTGRPTMYSPYLSSQFAKRFGYRIEDHLYVLTETSELDEEDYRIRLDYATLLTTLFCASMERLRTACHQHGMLSVGHLDNDHVALGGVICGYGNYLACLKTLDIPGVDVIVGQLRSKSDNLGGGCTFFPRLASSAAHQTGTLLSLSESCSVYGNSLSTDEIRYILGYQLVRGITVFNLMLMPYSVDKWYGYGQRPYFHPTLPGFSALTALNEEMSRTSYFMSIGKPAPKAALYLPWADFWRGDSERNRIAEAYKSLGESLEAACVDFDLIDAETLLTGKLTDGMLCCGISRYSTVYVPNGASVSEEEASIIAQLSHNHPPLVKTDNSCIKHTVNTDSDGNHFICLFNQSSESGQAHIHLALSPGVMIDRYDPQDGSVSAFVNGSLCDFAYGQIVLLHVTHETIQTIDYRSGNPITLHCDHMTKIKAFDTPQNGITYREVREDAPFSESFTDTFGDAFSGVVRYHFNVSIDELCDYLLANDRLEYSAKIIVNGVDAGTIATAPYRLKLPSSLFHAGSNTLAIDVENLASNAYHATPVTDYYDPAHLGPYNEPSQRFERDVTGGGLFGAVTLTALHLQ